MLVILGDIAVGCRVPRRSVTVAVFFISEFSAIDLDRSTRVAFRLYYNACRDIVVGWLKA